MIRIFNHYVHSSALRGMVFDLCIVLLVAAVAVGMQVGSVDQAVPLAGKHVVSFAACLFVINTASGLYDPLQAGSAARAAARAIVVLLIALPITYLIFGLLPTSFANRTTVQLSMLAGVSALILRRAYLSHSSAAAAARTRILIFGAGPAAVDVGQTLHKADPNAHIVGYLAGPNEREPAVPGNQILAQDGTLPEIARKHAVDELVVALTERRAGSMPLRQLLDCKVSGIKVYDLATHFEKTLGQIRVDYLNASWLIFGDGFNQGAWRTAVKRVFDILCASILGLLALPVMIAAAIAIKLESPGPVLYRQERVGQNGRGFSVTKFRSMRTDAEKDGRPVWAQANDARVTRVGQFIRRTRIDELPQLFNVLRGDMSLVGPRPERAFFVEQLTQEIPFYALRHSVKPGVTGWAQVRYPYGATVEDSLQKLQFDLYYVKNHTLFLDLVVLLETVAVVLTGKGAR
ncbi:MAG: TIGR03013 family PEP-CTERM/XrtA system glycosyltransferase [Rubrivivax sp.]|nr:TIGR03013 family PEP-CTERM/XrtA system glycosyltransferase [Rubrivivax sp.]